MEAAATDRTSLLPIHGAWLSSGPWENFIDFFEHRGFALDQCWDLLRQRRALREAGLDPEAASVRDANIVEQYEQ